MRQDVAEDVGPPAIKSVNRAAFSAPTAGARPLLGARLWVERVEGEVRSGGVGAITSPSIIEFVDAPIEGASFARRRLDLGAIIIENLHFACHPCR